MDSVSLEDLQSKGGAVLDRIEAGEHFTVLRDGRPVAELRPVRQPLVAGLRPFGLCAGEFVVPDDFDAPLPHDILRDFEGT